MQTRRRLLLLLAAAGCAACAAPERPEGEVAVDLDRVARALIEERRVPGLAAVVLEHDRLVYRAAHGKARIEPPAPVTPETSFDLGSISKTFTAAAAMTLVDRGAMAVDDEVSRWLPELAAAGEIRLRDLLAQTAGLREVFNLPGYPALAARQSAEPQLAAVFAEIAKAPRVFAAGERWSYSNSNYAALALLVERASGMPYGRFLSEQVLAPAGLAAIRPCAEVAASGIEPATLYHREADGAFAPFSVDAERHLFTGFGELCGTAEDVARFFRDLGSGRVVSRPHFKRMTSPARPVEDGEAAYGFGVSLRPLAGRAAIWHTGSSGTVAAYFPETETTIVVFTNLDASFAEESLLRFARTYWNLPAPPPLDPSPPGADEVASFTGRFDDGLFRFAIEFRDGALWLDNPPFGAPRRLARTREGRFVSVEEPEGIALEIPDAARNPGVDLVFEWAAMRSFARRVAAAP